MDIACLVSFNYDQFYIYCSFKWLSDCRIMDRPSLDYLGLCNGKSATIFYRPSTNGLTVNQF